MNLEKILLQLGFPQKSATATPFLNEEDGSEYTVWHIQHGDRNFVLKRAKGRELQNYCTYLAGDPGFAPKLIAWTDLEGECYLLLEMIHGENLIRCNRQKLTAALDALISMQKRYWGAAMAHDALDGRQNRRQYLRDALLEKAYDGYLSDCKSIPATLCHDDLLGFNVLVSGDRGVFIDWELAAVLPYPASLARLITHAEESDDAFFYMTRQDKEFAVQYYFDRLVCHRGISYESYRKSMDFALFYEYCEWVFVGNKYQQTDTERYKRYYDLAVEQAKKLGF